MSSPAPGKATEKRRGCSSRASRGPRLPPSPPRARQSTRCAEIGPRCQDGRPCRQALGWGWPGSAEEEEEAPRADGLLVPLMREAADGQGSTEPPPCSGPATRAVTLGGRERVQETGAGGVQ